jgi:hypothetical protein
MSKDGAAGLIAAPVAGVKFNAPSRLPSASCCFVDNSDSSASFTHASACLGGLLGEPPPITS